MISLWLNANQHGFTGSSMLSCRFKWRSFHIAQVQNIGFFDNSLLKKFRIRLNIQVESSQ